MSAPSNRVYADYQVSLAGQARRWRRRLCRLASTVKIVYLPDGTLKCESCGGEWERDGNPDHFTDCTAALVLGLRFFLAQVAKEPFARRRPAKGRKK